MTKRHLVCQCGKPFVTQGTRTVLCESCSHEKLVERRREQYQKRVARTEKISRGMKVLYDPDGTLTGGEFDRGEVKIAAKMRNFSDGMVLDDAEKKWIIKDGKLKGLLMEIEKLEKEVIGAYKMLETNTLLYNVAVNHLADVQAGLDMKISKALYEGKIKGSNEDKRTAAARAMFGDEYTLLAVAKRSERDARQVLQISQIAVDRVRLLVRLLKGFEDDNRSQGPNPG